MSGPSFHYVRATGLEDAVAAGGKRGAVYLAGGTDLLQLWKAGLAAPQEVIDISRLLNLPCPLHQLQLPTPLPSWTACYREGG